jgi:aminomethyltransferase
MKQTSLHDVHLQLGARLVEFGGWHMPVQYGPILDEVRCVRERAGLFDLGHMGRIRLAGRDALSFCDRVSTCYAAKLAVGAIRYSFLCREDGNPIDDLLVYRGLDHVYLVVNASNTDAVLAWLGEQQQGFAVEIDDETERSAMLAVQGQRSEQVLQRVAPDQDLASLGYYKFTFGTLCGMPRTRISRTGYTGEDGFEVYFEAAQGPRVWASLSEAGADVGLRPIGLGARDILRLEAGMPLYGHEIDAQHNPIEAGLEFGVSFHADKAGTIGRAALERIRAHPRRRLVGLVTEGPRVPRQGTAVYDGEQAVGVVCSGAPSPTLDTNIATAYLELASGVATTPGTSLALDFRGKRQACTVHALPFFSRTRR